MPRDAAAAEFIELIPGLPDVIALECLTRLHYTSHRVASAVSKRWCDLLRSKEFYNQRKQSKKTHKAACLVQAIPVKPDEKRVGPPSFGISVYDSVCQTWDRLDPIPGFTDGVPMYCRLISSEGKLVVMGGWDPVSCNSLTRVFVYDFTARGWRKGKDMPGIRTLFAAAELNGRVVIAGGHDSNKNALDSVWMYDVDKDEWTQLGSMSQERDECEAVVINSRLWIVGGYITETQGRFEASAEFYDTESGEWKRVENVWIPSRCPQSCVGVKKGEKSELFWWGGFDQKVRDGTRSVQMGELTFITGSANKGRSFGMYIVGGQNGKMEKINAPPEFRGSILSGCCVEI